MSELQRGARLLRTAEKHCVVCQGFVGYVGQRGDIIWCKPGVRSNQGLGFARLTPPLTGVYTVDAYSFQLQQRYIADTVLDFNWVEGRDVDINTVSSGNYTNMRLGYVGEFANGGTWNLGLNVNNLLDRDPPRIAGFGTRGGSQIVTNGL